VAAGKRLTCRQEAETSEALLDTACAEVRRSVPLEGLALLAAKEFAPSGPAASEAVATCCRGVEASTLLLAALAPRGTWLELWW